MPPLLTPIPARMEARAPDWCPADTGRRRLPAALCAKYVPKLSGLEVAPPGVLAAARTARTAAPASHYTAEADFPDGQARPRRSGGIHGALAPVPNSCRRRPRRTRALTSLS